MDMHLAELLGNPRIKANVIHSREQLSPIVAGLSPETAGELT